ncbi:MAG: hypothetical protein WCW17_01695 [Patescibacteria group bacterium]|jgi:hypothetical protein
MKITHVLLTAVIVAMPNAILAVSSNSQGQGSVSSNSSSSTSVNSNSANSNSQSGTGIQTQNQTQTNNAGASTQIQTQTEEETQAAAKVKETAPKYIPTNSKSVEHKSVVANAVQSLIQASYQLENTGLGDQVRTIAQTQSQNQDKIGQAVDNADKRTGFAKFFIGVNYKELRLAKTAMEQNRTQIQELEQLMAQIDNEGDKLEIANQIIVLQNQQIELKDQLAEETSGFSLFGWLARWRNSY